MNESISINVEASIVTTTNAAAMKYYCNIVKRHLIDIVKLNKIDLCANDKIVELYFHNKELESDNISDEGFTTIIDGRIAEVYPYNLKFVPIKILKDIKEGDVINYSTPCTAYIHNPSDGSSYEEISTILHLTVVCKQKGSEYETIGNFEDALKYVSVTMIEVISEENKKENKNNEERFIMTNYIKEKWNNLPKGVKTGIKIGAGLAGTAAVVLIGNEVYSRYRGNEPEVIEMATDEESEVAATTEVVSEEESNTIVIPD